ncbi:MAG: DUF6694 family lipoprotein [Morganella sp. (in: enterobacteria)]|uniref:Lipoprotein n=1 Tax=Morganella psychrotolerans TaxID=368603 RepID=A0A1B8H119_9GAMM|nr:DUF6694 family lipoprotein [Morganella psychrotolerans]OBU02753.1 hypothetical protein AYY18_12180 [Morganella psychrotolerans]
MKKILAVIALSFVLAGCGEATLDMSTQETAKESITTMEKDLSPEDARELKGAITKIGFQAAFASGGDEAKMMAAMKEKLQGKTAKEIIELAK